VTENVVHLDEHRRLRALIVDWRRLDVGQIRSRFQSICMEQRRGVRLPTDVYDAWLQMSAVLVVCGGKT